MQAKSQGGAVFQVCLRLPLCYSLYATNSDIHGPWFLDRLTETMKP